MKQKLILTNFELYLEQKELEEFLEYGYSCMRTWFKFCETPRSAVIQRLVVIDELLNES